MKNSTSQNLRKLTLASAVALTAGWGTLAQAGTDTANVAVSATVVANCTITSAGLAFGNYDPVDANSAAALDGTGTVTVTCTSGSPATITLGQGANADTSSTDAAPLRRLKDGGTNHLSYSLFSDTERTTVWGDGATVDVGSAGTGSAVDHTVYGRVASGQNVPAGSYADTVVATVTF